MDNWDFGVDGTGNIMNIENVKRLERKCHNINLITADGSINCFDEPENQEERVSDLHLAEAITALKILQQGGNFLIKKFTFFEHYSIALMYLLVNCFENVHVYKPATSKSGNSEVYVVCLNYYRPFSIDTDYLNIIFENIHNKELAMYPQSVIPDNFLEQLKDCCMFFMYYQVQTIELNILSFGKDAKCHRMYNCMRIQVWEEYVRRYNLRKISSEQKILNDKQLIQVSCSHRSNSNSSYTERQSKHQLSKVDKKEYLRNEFKDMCYNTYSIRNYTEIFEFNMSSDNNGVKFKIYTGSIVKNIVGSKFVPFDILEFHIEVFNIFRHKSDNTKLFNINSTKDTITVKVNIEPYYSIEDNDVFEKYLAFATVQALTVNENLDKIIFENIPLFTHFMVGFFYFLAKYVFESLEFYSTGGIIQLKTRRFGSIGNLKKFTTLRMQWLKKREENRSILSFMNIPNLYEQKFFQQIQTYNQFLCFKFCGQIFK